METRAPFKSEQELNDRWHAWVKGNIDRGCDNLELFYILISKGFSVESIRNWMGKDFPYLAPQCVEPGEDFLKAIVDYKSLASVALTTRGADPHVKRLDDGRLQLFVIDDFMSVAECSDMVGKIESRLHPSAVTFHNGDSLFRTSRTCELHSIRDSLIEQIDDRICSMLGIRGSYSEGIQGQQYLRGQEFKAHNDYFEPGSSEFNEFAASRGQRTWTFMVYLDVPEDGGGTGFVNLGLAFRPVMGRAVVWNNLRPDGSPNPYSMHQGQPVEAGKKTIITKWFRDKGLGPLMY